MRIISVILVWIFIIGGIFAYMAHQNAGRKAVLLTNDEVIKKKTTCRFEITSTFTAESDPFALTLPGEESNTGFILKVGNRTILKKADNIQAGIPFTTEEIANLAIGTNEAWLEASPPVDNYTLHNAVRLAVFQGDQKLSEKTLWSEPGAKIAGTVSFELKEIEEGDSHDH